MRTLIVASLTAGCLSVIPAFAADCHTDPGDFVWGQDTGVHMTVRSGKTCIMHIHTTGGGMSSSSIPKQAQYGIVSEPQSYFWQYTPKAAYTGKDEFVVQMVGESMGRRVLSGATNLSVDVDVVP